MTDDNWITFACLTLLATVAVFAMFYSSGAFGQTVIAECDAKGVCYTTREILEAILAYIQQLEQGLKGKCA